MYGGFLIYDIDLITYHISTAGEYGNLIVDMQKIEIGKNCRK